MSERSATLLIDGILEAASKIVSYTAGMAREDLPDFISQITTL